MRKSRPDTEVEVGAVGAPEQAVVVHPGNFGVEDSLILHLGGSEAKQEVRQQKADQDGQLAKSRHLGF